jgi:hypothetical protein
MNNELLLPYLSWTTLRQVVGKCLESPETFVEIPQKLEVSNKTMSFSISEVIRHNEHFLF